jgi:hypothetical protein
MVRTAGALDALTTIAYVLVGLYVLRGVAVMHPENDFSKGLMFIIG